MTEVRLRELTSENWQACVALELADDQRDFIEPNAVSIAESRFHPWMLPLAIEAGDELVGFVMFSDAPDPRAFGGAYWVHRFMIDRRRQGRGYGRAAMALVIEHVRAKPACDALWIGYHPANEVARRFYASLGFVEHGEAPWGGDIIARLALR